MRHLINSVFVSSASEGGVWIERFARRCCHSRLTNPMSARMLEEVSVLLVRIDVNLTLKFLALLMDMAGMSSFCFLGKIIIILVATHAVRRSVRAWHRSCCFIWKGTSDQVGILPSRAVDGVRRAPIADPPNGTLLAILIEPYGKKISMPETFRKQTHGTHAETGSLASAL